MQAAGWQTVLLSCSRWASVTAVPAAADACLWCRACLCLYTDAMQPECCLAHHLVGASEEVSCWGPLQPCFSRVLELERFTRCSRVLHSFAEPFNATHSLPQQATSFWTILAGKHSSTQP